VDYDLSIEIPATMDQLSEAGIAASVNSIMDSMGVVMAPTLDVEESGPYEVTELQTLGRFQLGRELGRGGMGRVLEAHDPELRRNVAVKIVIDPNRVSEAQLARFVAEAQITSQLEHPNIPPIYDIGVSREGHVYFVMKKVIGPNLRDVLRDLKRGDDEAVETWNRHRLLSVFLAVCNAVSYAHHRGVLHRDLKPDNILLGHFGEVLVMDWGVAKIMKRGRRNNAGIDRLTLVQTSVGQAIGTPGYMSVEQTLGEVDRLDERSDVWSLGAMLYEVLTLRRAYVATSTHEMLKAVCSGPPEDPRRRAPEAAVPEELAAIVNRAMESAPEDRYPSAEAMADEVRAWLEGAQRRQAARQHLDDASRSWVRYLSITDETERLHAEDEGSDGRRDDLELRRVNAFEQVLAGCEFALQRDPDNGRARGMLARAYMERYRSACRSGDRYQSVFWARRARLYDDGRHADELKGS